jgi:hypothetical protein
MDGRQKGQKSGLDYAEQVRYGISLLNHLSGDKGVLSVLSVREGRGKRDVQPIGQEYLSSLPKQDWFVDDSQLKPNRPPLGLKPADFLLFLFYLLLINTKKIGT